MLDIKLIRDNAELVKKAAVDKRIKCDVDRLIEVDRERRGYGPLSPDDEDEMLEEEDR